METIKYNGLPVQGLYIGYSHGIKVFQVGLTLVNCNTHNTVVEVINKEAEVAAMLMNFSLTHSQT
jgi:hypothetical protein